MHVVGNEDLRGVAPQKEDHQPGDLCWEYACSV